MLCYNFEQKSFVCLSKDSNADSNANDNMGAVED